MAFLFNRLVCLHSLFFITPKIKSLHKSLEVFAFKIRGSPWTLPSLGAWNDGANFRTAVTSRLGNMRDTLGSQCAIPVFFLKKVPLYIIFPNNEATWKEIRKFMRIRGRYVSYMNISTFLIYSKKMSYSHHRLEPKQFGTRQNLLITIAGKNSTWNLFFSLLIKQIFLKHSAPFPLRTPQMFI